MERLDKQWVIVFYLVLFDIISQFFFVMHGTHMIHFLGLFEYY